MDCPVCKYPNPQGATHCGMCYEVFNRSAAQAYMHAVKKERRETEGVPEEPQIESPSEKIIQDTESAFSKVDWSAIKETAFSLVKRARIPFLIVISLVGLWMIAGFLFNPSLWYHLFGKKMSYEFSGKASAQYLVGMKQHVKSWSERGGRLDTPMEEFSLDEMGNVLLSKTNMDNNRVMESVSTKEWIQIFHDAAGDASHTLPNSHPSLFGARLVFDKNGTLLERRYTLSPRLAKSLPFLVPRLPPGALRRGRTWNESVEWLDVYNDWKIYWSGTLHWTLGELEPCGDAACAKLTYTADLRPQLRGTPDWAQGAARRADTNASAEGAALFDAAHHQIVSNTFSYDGILRVPVADLGRIPWELRIGRRVKGVPGVIMIRFENKIDIRKN